MTSKIISKEDLDKLETRYRAQLINSISGFKPINLIGTKDQNSLTNLAIISSVVHLGASPAMLAFISRPDTVERHTLENIRDTKYYTINHINSNILEKSHQTSARYNKEQSEFNECQFTHEYMKDFHAPFVKESKIKIAMKLVREIKIEENSTVFIIGEICFISLPESIIQIDGHINIEEADTICGSGLDHYHKTNSLGRLSYAKPDAKTRWLS